MTIEESLGLPREDLAEAWRRALPEWLGAGDHADVWADEVEQQTLHVHIDAAGRQDVSFDFAVRYKDRREIDIQLKDAEKSGATVDERTPQMQELISDYRRHLHECAQALHAYTNH